MLVINEATVENLARHLVNPHDSYLHVEHVGWFDVCVLSFVSFSMELRKITDFPYWWDKETEQTAPKREML